LCSGRNVPSTRMVASMCIGVDVFLDISGWECAGWGTGDANVQDSVKVVTSIAVTGVSTPSDLAAI
jgi:hypothetical protein